MAPDVAHTPEPETEPEFADKLVALRDRLDEQARIMLTGSSNPSASIRRTILFLTVAVALVLNVPALGIIALGVLMLTDQVVEL